MSGALERVRASDEAEIVQSKVVPTAIAGSISQEEWDTMPANDRIECYRFFQEEMAETTSNLKITFPRIKYPTSGTGVFECPSPTGEPDYRPTLTGVVIAKQPVRAYWPINEPIANNPPKCSSPDGIRPTADSEDQQAAYCDECPQSKFGTGKEGQGQACKQRLNVFMLLDRAGIDLEEIPTLLSVPPSQLKTFNNFAVQLRKVGSPLLAQCTVFSLVNATSKNGTAYKGLALKLGRKLTYAEMKQARSVSDAFEEQMVKRGFAVDDADDAGDDPGTIDSTAETLS